MVIRVENLVKDFRADFWKKKKRVLDGVSFCVKEGSVYGFLGPNGAGKTTTIKILMGLLFADSGKALIFDTPIDRISFKKDVGYLPESPNFYEYLKAHEFLRFYGELFGLKGKDLDTKVDKLLAEVGLSRERDLQLRKFSKGMLQRIGLAQALINDPKLMILDEPMSGLDPIGRKNIRDIIIKCRDEGKTIFFSSHILSDVEMICDQVSIIVEGRVVDSGFIKDLLNPRVLYYEVEILKDSRDGLGKFLDDKNRSVTLRGKSLIIRVDGKELRQVTRQLMEKNIDVLSVTPIKETLEDLFVEKVGVKAI